VLKIAGRIILPWVTFELPIETAGCTYRYHPVRVDCTYHVDGTHQALQSWQTCQTLQGFGLLGHCVSCWFKLFRVCLCHQVCHLRLVITLFSGLTSAVFYCSRKQECRTLDCC
jgi:hypothetical protein